MSDRDSDLAKEIYAAITSDESIAEAVIAWKEIGYPAWATEARDMRSLFSHVAGCAISAVLARRQREAARTGPWDGSMLAGTNPGDTPAKTGGAA